MACLEMTQKMLEDDSMVYIGSWIFAAESNYNMPSVDWDMYVVELL